MRRIQLGREEVEPIRFFQGEHHFLSNFAPSPFVYFDHGYMTVEHAFQCFKTTDPVEQRRIRGMPSPRDAKRAGKLVTLREDWSQIRVPLMHQLVFCKFIQNLDLALKLAFTYPSELVEGNTWGDTFWGEVNGRGQNQLGKILMDVRENLRTVL